MAKRTFRCMLLFLSALGLPVLACSIGGNPLTEGPPLPVTEPPQDVDTEGPAFSDPWLEATLALRAVDIELVTIYPGSDPQTVSIQINGQGNVHLTFPMPVPPEATPEVEFVGPDTYELFIIDGVAYSSTAGEAAVIANDSYLTLPEDILLGPDGPGFWLSLFPEESFTTAGTEAQNGFDATKLTVDGQIDEGTVSGMIWVDNASNALVGAELSISESLYYPPNTGHEGIVQITLTVQQNDGAPILLP